MKKIIAAIALVGAIALLAVSCSTPAPDLPDGLYAQIVTGKGDIIVKLEPDKAPATTMNFVGLAEGTIDNTVRPGKPFYDGITFHRVEDGFVIQSGDPNGDGTGGPGYQFPNETSPDLTHDKAGTVAMANSGPDTNGSQFYITLTATPFLDGGYSVFGYVVQGMDVASQIVVGDKIRQVRILRIGDKAKSYEASTDAFHKLTEAILQARTAANEKARADELDAAKKHYPGLAEYENTGLLLAVLKPGTGSVPVAGQRIKFDVVLRLLNGTQIDSTRDRGQPQEITFMRDRQIRGLELALGTMKVGEQKVAILPPDLAFGSQGLQGSVPADSYVIVEIERLQ